MWLLYTISVPSQYFQFLGLVPYHYPALLLLLSWPLFAIFILAFSYYLKLTIYNFCARTQPLFSVCVLCPLLFETWPLFTISILLPGYYLKPSHCLLFEIWQLFTISVLVPNYNLRPWILSTVFVLVPGHNSSPYHYCSSSTDRCTFQHWNTDTYCRPHPTQHVLVTWPGALIQRKTCPSITLSITNPT
jgi:hypothetical protein